MARITRLGLSGIPRMAYGVQAIIPAVVVEDDGGNGGATPSQLTLTKELREDEEVLMLFVREYMKKAA